MKEAVTVCHIQTYVDLFKRDVMLLSEREFIYVSDRRREELWRYDSCWTASPLLDRQSERRKEKRQEVEKRGEKGEGKEKMRH